MLHRSSYILFISVFFSGFSFSQDLSWRQLSLARENSAIKYNTFTFDSSGLMWLGTSNGLYQYDGFDFKNYLLNNKKEFNDVTAIATTDSSIWVGYRSGKLAQLKMDSLSLFLPAEGLPAKQITSIIKSKDGIMWFATAGEGIYFLLNNRLYNINEDDGLSSNYVYCLAEDEEGNTWAGTDAGISVCQAVLHKKIIRRLKYTDGLPDEIIRVLCKDAKGNIQIGTQDKGACVFDYEKNKFFVPSEYSNWKSGQINSMIISDHEIWMATEEKGLFNYNYMSSQPAFYDAAGNPKLKKIICAKKDKEENIWCLTESGLAVTYGNSFKILDKINKEKINFIHALLSTKDKHLFFTPDQQLTSISQLNTSDETKYSITSSTKLIDIVSLYEDSDGYIWVATMGDGLFRLNPKTASKQKIQGRDLPDNASILSIAGSSKEIWLATLEGILKSNLEKVVIDGNEHYSFAQFEKYHPLENYFINTVFIDSKNRKWFGTDGNGLILMDGEKLITYDSLTGMKGDVVFSLSEDADKNIWLSTDAGLYKFDGRSFTLYNLSNGFRELSATSIRCDGNGNLVCAHKQGVDVLNIKTGVIQYFNMSGPAEELNPDLNAITGDGQGNVWIGTEKGILIYNSRFKNSSAKTIPIIKKVTLLTDNSFIDNGQSLKHHQNSLAIEFAGLWYSNPDEVKYEYQLEGHDKGWIATRDRKIIFPDLTPGNYIFKLRASSFNNFELASVASFSFTINKPFWATWWFRAALILLIAAIVLIVIRYRDRHIRKMQALENEKMKFQFEILQSQVNPHFLFNSFNTLISIIEKDKNVAIEYVENLSEYFRSLINYRDKDLIQLEEEVKLSSAYYLLQQKRFGKNLNINMEIDPAYSKWLVPPLVVQILLENAIKHNAVSRETPLFIHILTENEKLVIKNNLNPKQTLEKSTGTGITNIISRYELLTYKRVEIIKSDTEFIVALPLIENRVL